jgi:hypothetical protein
MMNMPLSQVRGIQPAIELLLDRSSALRATCDGEPPAGSPLALDLASATRPESIATAVSIGDLALEYAADHLSAFARLMSEPIEVLACFTCIRSMLEMSAIGAWVLDPAISSHDRVQRVFAKRFEGLEQQLKFGRCSSLDARKISDIENRIQHIESEALLAGYPKYRSPKNGRITAVGMPMPGATDMIRDVLDDEWLYRLLSAVAHGEHWAIVQLGFENVTGQQGSFSLGATQMSRFRKAVSTNCFALLGLHGFLAFGRVLWNKARYSGWPLPAVRSILDEVADAMSAKPDVRFWK